MTSEEKEKSKEQLALLLEDKGKKEYDRKQGIKDYEINDETIDGDKATVKVKIIYGNGEEKEETMSLRLRSLTMAASWSRRMMLSLVCSRRMMLLSDGGDVSEDWKNGVGRCRVSRGASE